MSTDLTAGSLPGDRACELPGAEDAELRRRRFGAVRRPPSPGLRRDRPAVLTRRPRPLPRPARRPARRLVPAWPPLAVGAPGVRWLQGCLNQALGLDLPVTGIWSPTTRAALRAFQRQFGRWPSGFADPHTRALLERACAYPSAVETIPEPPWHGPDAPDTPQPEPDEDAPVGAFDGDDAAPDAEELGPLTARIRWLFRRNGNRLDYLFPLSEAARQPGGGVYILVGTERRPGARPMLLKVGLAPSFRARFGASGYGRATGTPQKAPGLHYDNLAAYLGQVDVPPSPLPQIERALARLLYRAGETLPLDLRPPREGPVRGPVRIANIVPPGLDRLLRAAYLVPGGNEARRARTGGARPLMGGRPPQVPAAARTRQLLLDPGQFPRWELGRDSSSTQPAETPMHAHPCPCPECRAARHRAAVRSPFTEEEELALAMELLSVASEEELDRFLGKLFKGAWRGLKKVGRFIGKVAKPIGRALKGVAKVALPFVGKALGSFIPIPGVGTMLGGAVGSAIGKALEAEYAGLEGAEQSFEMARAFVRTAGAAARDVAATAPDGASSAALEAAFLRALQRRTPGLAQVGMRPPVAAPAGRWVRQGAAILVLNA